MHVVVVGAGIIGVTSAYWLRRAGFEVTVVERRNGVAQETSFANAGVMAPSYVAPWAQPGMPAKVLSYLFKAESPIVFRPTADPAIWSWIRRWLGECELERFTRNKGRMQRLAFYSQALLRELRVEHKLEYEQVTGYLQLFRNEHEIKLSAPARAMLSELGVAHALVSAATARQIEPALSDQASLAGALHLPDDETGNCAFFAHQLKDIAIGDGVQFRFGVTAHAIGVAGANVTGVMTDNGLIKADLCVIAGGIDSRALLRPLGIQVPLIPVKGYSASVAVTAPDHAPAIGVMDETYKVAITRMGKRLRIAGTAEIGTRGMKLRDGPLRTLLTVARHWYPGAAPYAKAQFWVGARPMLPDGPPLLGATPVKNLFLNIGHGSTGWVMACGSARIVTDLMTGRTPEIDLDGLTLDRYARASSR
jgi:D-amino-acid dehydrogenase